MHSWRGRVARAKASSQHVTKVYSVHSISEHCNLQKKFICDSARDHRQDLSRISITLSQHVTLSLQGEGRDEGFRMPLKTTNHDYCPTAPGFIL